MTRLPEVLAALPLLDQHAHNVLRPEFVAHQPYPTFFSEGPDMEPFARHSLFFQRSLRDVAALLECEPREAEVTAARQRLTHVEWTGRCLGAARLEALYLDDGLTPDRVESLEWHAQFVPVRRIVRLESLAECHSQGASFAEFEQGVRTELQQVDCVAFKSIAAYRTGLALAPVTTEEARRSYRPDQQRLSDPVLLACLWDWLLEAAAERNLPVQLHTGFGDPDLDLALADPLHLRPWLHRHRQARWVLLHGSYPFSRQAGYLASVYPHVYLDFGLAVPFLSVQGMMACLRQLLELTPVAKLLYSSDASRIPELYWLGARWGRNVVVRVLEECIAQGELDEDEAERWGRSLLAENASSLYRRS